MSLEERYERPSPIAGPSRLSNSPTASNSPVVLVGHGAAASPRKVPMTKALQACNRCRNKKIKCVLIDESNRDTCKSCTSAGLACTFDLPLTASRVKRVKKGLSRTSELAEHPPMQLGPTSTPGPSRAFRDIPRQSVGHGAVSGMEVESQWGQTTDDEVLNGDGRDSLDVLAEQAQGMISSMDETLPCYRYGPTSLTYILHSSPTVPLDHLSRFDKEEGYEIVKNHNNDGYVALKPPDRTVPAGENAAHGTPDDWQRSAQTYIRSSTAKLLPIATERDKAEERTEITTLGLVMAYLGANIEKVDTALLLGLKGAVQASLERDHVLYVPSIENIRVLLLIQLSDDLSTISDVVPTPAVSRTRLSTAIRMAQDVGLDSHRASTSEKTLWKCAAILDLWQAVKNGTLPIITRQRSSKLPTRDVPELTCAFEALYELSMLLGRLLQLLYGPSGVRETSDREVLDLRSDLRNWKKSLSGGLTFHGPDSSAEAGTLQLLYVTLNFLLHRPFMRWSFVPPSRFTIDMDIPAWFDILDGATAAIAWSVDKLNDRLLVLPFLAPYLLGTCAFVEYHHWVRRKERDGLRELDRLSDAVEAWSRGLGGLPILRRQLSLIPHLSAIAHSPASPTSSSFHAPRGLNPTPGVQNRLPEASINGIAFIKDPSHPRGGVLVVTSKAAREIRDLPEGAIVLGADVDAGYAVHAAAAAALTETERQRGEAL